MPSAQDIPHAVGTFLAETRRELALTLDQVAGAARAHGAAWSASSVRNIERGQASLNLQTLIVLALALGDLRGAPLRLKDLLGEATDISLGGGVQIERGDIDAALSGEFVRRRNEAPRLAGGAEGGPVLASLAETRAAEKLGIDVAQLREIAFELWGQTLEAEVRERAGGDSTPQARGRVSRKLLPRIVEQYTEKYGRLPGT